MLLPFIHRWNLMEEVIHAFKQTGSLNVLNPFRGSEARDTPISVDHIYMIEVKDLTQRIDRKSYYQILGIYTKTKLCLT
jgi:hypothetical protein